jgi:hypothetical protein
MYQEAPRDDTWDRLIPTKNPQALLSYYIGLFSLLPCVGAVMGPAAIWLGAIGLAQVKQNPRLHGKGHAITGIICGTIFGLLNIALLVFVLILYLNRNSKPSPYLGHVKGRSSAGLREITWHAFAGSSSSCIELRTVPSCSSFQKSQAK